MITKRIEVSPGVEVLQFSTTAVTVKPGEAELPGVESDARLVKLYHEEDLVRTNRKEPLVARFEGLPKDITMHLSDSPYAIPPEFRDFAMEIVRQKAGRDIDISRTGVFPLEKPREGGYNGSAVSIASLVGGDLSLRETTYFAFLALCQHMGVSIREFDQAYGLSGAIRDLECIDGRAVPMSERVTPNMLGTGSGLLAPHEGGMYFVGGSKKNTELFPGSCDIIGTVPTWYDAPQWKGIQGYSSFEGWLVEHLEAGLERELGVNPGFDIKKLRFIDEFSRGATSILATLVTETPLLDIMNAYCRSQAAQDHFGVAYGIPADRVALDNLEANGLVTSSGARAARYFALQDVA